MRINAENLMVFVVGTTLLLTGCQSNSIGAGGKTSLNSLLGLNKSGENVPLVQPQAQNAPQNGATRLNPSSNSGQKTNNRPAAGYVSPDCFQFAYSTPDSCVKDIKLWDKP